MSNESKDFHSLLIAYLTATSPPLLSARGKVRKFGPAIRDFG